jgi:hypothetical protein
MIVTQAPQNGMNIGARALQVGVLGGGRIGKIHSENLVTRIAGTELAILADVAQKHLL